LVPSYDPMDILEYIRAKLDGCDDLPPIRPFARGFTGRIAPLDDGQGFVSYGNAEKASAKSLIINELPLKCWTDQYKSKLLKMRDRGQISSFIENHTTSKVCFEVSLKSVQLKRMVKANGGLEAAFNLKSTLRTTNMNAFDSDGIIRKFESAEEIADAYFPVRLALYHDRKSVLESEMKYASALMRNKADFISSVAEGKIYLVNGKRSKEELFNQMKSLGFDTAAELAKIKDDNSFRRRRRRKQDSVTNDETEAENGAEDFSSGNDFDYLLNMPLSSLTTDRIIQLQDDASKKEQEAKEIENKDPADLWREDLEKLAPHVQRLKE
jgi:DNA topoisomerase-2